MRFILAFIVLLAVLSGATSSQKLHAQDVTSIETAQYPIETTSDRVNTVINAPDPSDHAGLLGKIFLQNRYRYQEIDNKFVGDSWQGFDTLLNLPAVTLDTETPLDIDLFAGYANVSSQRSRWYQPELKSEAFNVGVSIYPSLSTKWRPFVQVGARFIRNEVIGMEIDWRGFPTFVPTHQVDHDTRLLLNTGFEYDIFDSLAYRMTLFAETKDRFEDSIISHDLILWPVDRIFVRGGFSSDLGGDRLGFTIGGGLAF